jgi:putative ABC transport system permease protein
MEIGPIFRALINHKSRFWLITLEIALTLAIIVNCVNMIIDQRSMMQRPTGMDVENMLVIHVEPWAPEFKDEQFVEDLYDRDLLALRALPGVIAATGMSAIPLSGSGSATGRKAFESDGDSTTAPYFVVGDQALEALGVQLVEGRAFSESDFPEEVLPDQAYEQEQVSSRNVILTRDFADRLFPDGGALGSQISDRDGEDVEVVVGIIERMHGSWPQSSVAERVMLYPGRPAGTRRSHYVVRAEPGMVDGLYTSVDAKLLELNEGRLVRVKTMAEIKADQYSDEVAFSQLLGGLSVLLVLVTSLGIVGLTSFSVTQRTHEIGTRRALGATRLAILRYFLVENWVVTTAGLSLGLLLAIGLNYALATWANVPTVTVLQIVAAMIALWLVGLLAALVPALRGTRVLPVTATRNIY